MAKNNRQKPSSKSSNRDNQNSSAGETNRQEVENPTAVVPKTAKFLFIWLVIPYGLCWIAAQYLLPNNALSQILQNWGFKLDGHYYSTSTASTTTNSNSVSRGKLQYNPSSYERQVLDEKRSYFACFDQLVQNLPPEEQTAIQAMKQQQNQQQNKPKVELYLHRNGQVEACGHSLDIVSHLQQTLDNSFPECPVAFSKYEMESLLTTALHASLSECHSTEKDRQPEEGFFGYCDMGEERTPILLDHDELVPIDVYDSNSGETVTYLPCHFHTREGVRVTNFQNLFRLLSEAYYSEEKKECQDGESDERCTSDDNALTNRQVHLYAVPAGRVFMFAPAFVGEEFYLPHIQGADPTKPVYMKVLSLSPRVFDIFNFFTREESAGLVERALKETKESHRIKRSTTGAVGHSVFERRTSESGFDTHGETAQAVKRRCFDVLGFDEYIEGHSDGLQILRYNQTKAYVAHMDWIDDDPNVEHDFDSAKKGGNRYATILLYMTDLGPSDGGETVFVHGQPLEDDAPDYTTALQQLRDSEDAKLFQQGSWQETMVAQCRASLAVRPNSARAVLFYSQLPNGKPDPASLHGGCPVVTEQPKWAANLWVWNTPRSGFAGAPVKSKFKKEKTASAEEFPKKHATFVNEGTNPEYDTAELYYEDTYWAALGEGQPPQAAITYEGQVWNIRVHGQVKKTFVIGPEETQTFTI